MEWARTYLDVPRFMFVRHRQHPCNMSVQRPPPSSDIIVQPYQTCAHAIAKGEDVPEHRPILILVRDLGVALPIVVLVSTRDGI